MNRLIAAIIAALLTACGGSSTGPKGLDPTVLIINETAIDTVLFSWQDGQGVVGSVVAILPGAMSCQKFLARPDSAYFHASSREGAASTWGYTQPWFDPASRPGWTVNFKGDQGGFAVTDVSPIEPC